MSSIAYRHVALCSDLSETALCPGLLEVASPFKLSKNLFKKKHKSAVSSTSTGILIFGSTLTLTATHQLNCR